ncbi:hypothetical protein N8935_08835, partial [Amylibacter sp.]|nr:hypothetical protein [Amylibacter sp.]
PILLPIISSPNMKFTSFGGSYSRFEKIKIVSEFRLADKFLNVCTSRHAQRLQNENCSTCHKCMRTMLSLELLGKLEKFSNRFDLILYNKNKQNFIRKISLANLYGNNSDSEIHEILKSLSMHARPNIIDYIKLKKYYFKKLFGK